MYGQIPCTSVDHFKDLLEEAKVFVIRKFLCTLSRTSFRPVESTFMVQFTRFLISRRYNQSRGRKVFLNIVLPKLLCKEWSENPMYNKE
jgi:hypothetical protein